MKSPEWLKNKRAIISTKNNNGKCFKYAINAELNHQNIESHSERISNIEPLINRYNQKDIDFLSHQKEWKNFEQNNKTIALNIIYVPCNTKQIRLTYNSKYNRKRENQMILLMINDSEKWHYLPIKSLPSLLRGITSNRNGNFYCFSCFHSYRTDNRLKQT